MEYCVFGDSVWVVYRYDVCKVLYFMDYGVRVRYGFTCTSCTFYYIVNFFLYVGCGY